MTEPKTPVAIGDTLNKTTDDIFAEKCVMFDELGEWWDVDCSETRFVVCAGLTPKRNMGITDLTLPACVTWLQDTLGGRYFYLDEANQTLIPNYELYIMVCSRRT